MEAAEVAKVVGMVAECLDAGDYDEHEGITEESIAQVMSWFELEIKLAAGANTLPLPLSPPPELYATVSEGKESCEPLLSGSASTVMASVDGRAGAPPPLAEPWPSVPEPAVGDEDDVDDEWVLQLPTDGPPVKGQHGGQ